VESNHNFCINPLCRHPSGDEALCSECGLERLINGRYLPIRPLKLIEDPFSEASQVEVWIVKDLQGNAYCPPGGTQIMRLMFAPDGLPQQQFYREAEFLRTNCVQGIPKCETENLLHIRGDTYPEMDCLFQEYIDGQSLKSFIETVSKKFNEELVWSFAEQLITILKHVHQQRWFHGDISPDNIIVKPDRTLVLVDWGAVQRIDEIYMAAMLSGADLEPTIAPRHIFSRYSPVYGSMEQIRGKPVPQSDFFGVGMILVYLATTKSPASIPRESGTFRLLWHSQIKGKISPELVEILDWLIQEDLAHRPIFAHQILGKLEQCKSPSPRHRIHQKPLQWRWPLAAGLVGLGLAGLGALGYGAAQQTKQQVAAVVEQAQKAERVGNFRKARQIYEQALQRIPNNSSLLNNLALVCQDLKDLKCTKDKLEQAIQAEPRGWEALYNLAVLLEDEQNFPGARQLYQRSIQNGPREALPAINLSRLDILAGYPRRALDRLQAIPTQSLWDSNSQWGHAKNVGWAYYVLKDYPQADQWLRKAITIDPERADSYCLLAQLQDLRTNESQSSQIYWLNCLSRPIAVTPEVRRWRIARLKHEYPDVDFSF
jgi:serine/threonine protein kinase